MTKDEDDEGTGERNTSYLPRLLSIIYPIQKQSIANHYCDRLLLNHLKPLFQSDFWCVQLTLS